MAASEQQLRGTFWNIDPIHQLPARVVYVHLPCGDVHVALLIDRYALSSLFSEESQVRDGAIRAGTPYVRLLFRFI